MKNLFFSLIALLSICACSKPNDCTTYFVKYHTMDGSSYNTCTATICGAPNGSDVYDRISAMILADSCGDFMFDCISILK